MAQFQCINFALFLIVGFLSQVCNGADRDCSRDVSYLRPPCYDKNDDTLKENMTGIDVVEAVLGKFNCLKVFPCDPIFMQRIALVESDYGENYDIYGRRGGIWGLEKETFDKLFDYQDMLQDISDIISNRSGISFFNDVNYTCLSVPFYSGLAARLYLHYLNITNVSVPFNETVEKQADFWVNGYHRVNKIAEETARKYFINKTADLDFNCSINIDILFLLDDSSSIGSTEFSKMKEFLYRFVNITTIGPQDAKVGVVKFANYAQLVIPLNEHNTSTGLKNAIENIPHSGGFTNLTEGLCRLRDGFEDGLKSRPVSEDAEVFRVAIHPLPCWILVSTLFGTSIPTSF